MLYTTTQLPSNIISLPLAFVRSGYVSTNDGKTYALGNFLYDWSRTASSASFAYYLASDPNEIYPSYSSNRWSGYPLRWLKPHTPTKKLWQKPKIPCW